VPAKLRHPKERRSVFSAEVLAQFRALESTPPRRRLSGGFIERDLALHDALGLASERVCSVCSVLDRDRGPHRPRGSPVSRDWYRVREMRLELLDAIAGKEKTAPALRDRRAGAILA
jgi:hypothetical protein